ncbi:MAG: transposase [Opitutaceae bacterium]|nr:transposase [Opitutaceae bacterium]
MDELNKAEGIQLAGEAEFTFPTAGGRVRPSVTEDALTPYGGLVPWAAYTKHIGIAEGLAASCPIERSSPNAAPVYDVIQSFMLTALTDGRRFSRVERLREDPTIPELFGMEAVVSDDTVRRFFKSIDPQLGAEWIARNVKPMWGALPDQIIMDWDSTVQPKYGHQEGAEVGYNPGKPGRRSFHPLLGVVARTRLCPAYRFRSGDTVTATQWKETMEDAQRWLGDRQVWLNRGDMGLGHDAVMAWHEQTPGRPKFLFKLKLTNGVRNALHAVRDDEWQGPSFLGSSQVAEGQIQLTGWKQARRCVFERKLQGLVPSSKSGEFWDHNKHEFAVYVTNLPLEYDGRAIQQLYRERADTENVFDERRGLARAVSGKPDQGTVSIRAGLSILRLKTRLQSSSRPNRGTTGAPTIAGGYRPIIVRKSVKNRTVDTSAGRGLRHSACLALSPLSSANRW